VKISSAVKNQLLFITSTPDTSYLKEKSEKRSFDKNKLSNIKSSNND